VTDEPRTEDQPAEDQPAEDQPAEDQPLWDGKPADETAELTHEVATMLDALDGRPTAEHAHTYAALHARLQGALGDLDGE
jgi:hypothetical protein